MNNLLEQNPLSVLPATVHIFATEVSSSTVSQTTEGSSLSRRLTAVDGLQQRDVDSPMRTLTGLHSAEMATDVMQRHVTLRPSPYSNMYTVQAL